MAAGSHFSIYYCTKRHGYAQNLSIAWHHLETALILHISSHGHILEIPGMHFYLPNFMSHLVGPILEA